MNRISQQQSTTLSTATLVQNE